MAMVLAAKKSNCFKYYWEQNIYIPTMSVLLATKTSNQTGAMFELKVTSATK